ncbi:MAG: glucoamylase family protein [Anaerolineae bacterium]|nr:MAG: glucoamylase family protein [Anaerolineae bacterium]
MSQLPILLSYFTTKSEAVRALNALETKRLSRTAVASRTQAGALRLTSLRWHRTSLWMGAGALVAAAASLSIAALLSDFPIGLAIMAIPVGALVGWLVAWAVNRAHVARRFSDSPHWLTTEEVVLLLQADRDQLSRAMSALRGIADPHPPVYLVPPAVDDEQEIRWLLGGPMSSGQLQAHARHLGREHEPLPSPRKGEALLEALVEYRRTIISVQEDLRAAQRAEVALYPGGEWILDNTYLVEGHIQEVQRNLSKRFYNELPVVEGEQGKAQPEYEPRVYRLAKELVRHSEAHLKVADINAFLEAYQQSSELSSAELWAMPLMLRIVLSESISRRALEVRRRMHEAELAEFWAYRLLIMARGDADELFLAMAQLSRSFPEPTSNFGLYLLGHLYDEELVLVPVQSWLQRSLGQQLGAVSAQEQSRQAALQLYLSNAITSLRTLSRLDWREVFEKQSAVEQILRRDPDGVYGRMDFHTRDRYRNAIEVIAKGAGLHESRVAEETLTLAMGAAVNSTPLSPVRHVGYYLIDTERASLLSRLGINEFPRLRALQWARTNHTPLYLGSLTLASLSIVTGLGYFGLRLGIGIIELSFLILVSLIPASQVASQLINFLVTRILPPWTLPKMSFGKRGIGDAYRTLVVVPVVLDSLRTVDEEVEKLEIRYFTNRDKNLLYALFGDFADAKDENKEQDDRLLQHAIQRIKQLNDRHGADRFYLLMRSREWAETEEQFIGWERKRGKLEDLNRLIAGATPRTEEDYVRVGDAHKLPTVRFVITLDSDTMLTSESACRMVETLAHPLNEPQVGANGRLVRGYGIIQPRVSTALPSATQSFFTRLFNDPIGTDPYTTAVSDVYQDLTGEASYNGKGIYDPRVFHRILSERFPTGRILSHDLLEGAHVRTALATDIELFDEFPPDYRTYARREHRWIRGDWQIADWCLPWVPKPEGGRAQNPLSVLNRWKVFDNLRRSLVPLGLLSFLTTAWLLDPVLAVIAGLVTAFLVFFQPFVRLTTWARRVPGSRRLARLELGHSLLRSVVEASLIPHQTLIALDAIARVWYRRWVSRRKLLEWTTAQMAAWERGGRMGLIALGVGLSSLLAVVVGAALWMFQPQSLWSAGPFLAAWLVSPAIVWRLNARRKVRWPRERISGNERRMLRRIARKTWRYFDEFVQPGTHWLPPDNYQVSHQNQVALRTSPTNIGLWMLSALAGHDFGYISWDGILHRLGGTLQTLEELERFRGHFYNWYDLLTLKPLEPRYVSTVDSGNLVASLWSLRAGIEDRKSSPLFPARALEGLKETYEALVASLELHELTGAVATNLDSIGAILSSPAQGLGERIGQLDDLRQPAHILAERLGKAGVRSSYWAESINRQVLDWSELVERYLAWGRLLDELPTGPVVADRSPSIEELAQGEFRLDNDASDIGDLPDRLAIVMREARGRAAESLREADQIAAAAVRIGDEVEFGFLYDPYRRIFTVGYNASEMRRDESFYDLLASEARLASYVAIAKGDVSPEHWLALSRPYGVANGRMVLNSWGGTMFEYLMPMLFQRDFENSLLSSAMREAVEAQIDYAHRQGVPWGISESAYADLDTNKTYQYRAFGVPGLGLKYGLDQDLVVAPYATLLALEITPERTVANLMRLSEIGLESEYGFYEAIDFSRQRSREGERGVLVRAYMAHHQAMGLLALENFFHDGVIRRHFHSDPRTRAAEPLLYERIPVALPFDRVPTERLETEMVPVRAVGRSVSRFDTPSTAQPVTQLLSNGSYRVMVTGAGGGFSRWRDFDITRWRSDPTRDHWGLFFYLTDLERELTWSSTFQPMGGEVGDYSIRLALDRAEVVRYLHGIETQTQVYVAPEDDVEIRRLSLFNRGGHRRRLSVTSYAELAIAPHVADRSHPAFSKMFVMTEADAERQVLMAHRRPREPDEEPIYVAQGFFGDGEAWRYETDRGRFLGRGHGTADPALELSNTAGFVLDPVFSMQRTLELGPGERAELWLVMAAGDSREVPQALMEKYSESMAIERAQELAWTHAQIELRILRIQPDDARMMQKLASYLLYPSGRFRPPAERLAQNQKGQAGLWPYGISGDYPIVLASASEAREVGLIRELLQAHNYLRRHGLMADLVILNEEATSYEGALTEQLHQLVQAHSTFTGMDEPGGVYILKSDQIPEEDKLLLMSTARVSLNAARGSLSQQLAGVMPEEDLPEDLPTSEAELLLSTQLESIELAHFNGVGGFTPGGEEYVIEHGPNSNTPAPWSNVIANPKFGSLITESGSGFTWEENSQRYRLTGWSNDPVSDPPSEAVYIRDEESGEYWTPTPLPIREAGDYRTRHGAGYTVFEHTGHGIHQELLTFVPMDEEGGLPVKVQRLRMRNTSSRPRTLSVTFYVEWTLGEHREETQTHIVTRWDETARILVARNPYHPDGGQRLAFLALGQHITDFTASRSEFLGRNGDLGKPAAMSRVGLAGATGAGIDPCGAVRVEIDLAPGQMDEVVCLLGASDTLKEAQRLIGRFRERDVVEEIFQATVGWWEQELKTVQIETPEPALDLLFNRWLLYQSLSCRMWARSGFYQSGGAFGFRDQLQDSMALVYASPTLARQHLLLAASRQYVEGDVQHWWHPPSGIGVRTRISDDLLWLPYVVSHYVDVTGDVGILQELVGFLTAAPLEEGQMEAMVEPMRSEERAALYEHCRRAIDHALRLGPHGLPLMGGGDWNDGMNRVGAEGKGESVWLAWFMVEVLDRFAKLSERYERETEAEKYRERGRQLLTAIEQHAWDGDWYLRAYHDSGTPLGSKDSQEALIDSLPQSWAAIVGGGDPMRARQAMESARRELVLEKEGLALLFSPPFDGMGPDPGYIAGYPKGVRENGGQYTHAAIWQAMAWARLGEGDRALELLRLLNPIEHAQNPEQSKRYAVEPYVVAADVYNLEGAVGRGGWTWYTGSAAWMYRVILEELLGLRVRGTVLELSPVIPRDWKGFTIRYRHGDAIYEIRVDNPEGVGSGIDWVELDGRRLSNRQVPLERGTGTHEVRVRMGRSNP